MDVSVVGGGIVGLMSAYFLSEEADVTLYDPDPGSYSVHAAGLIEPYRFDKINTTSMLAKMVKYMRRGVTEVRQVNKLWLRELLLSLNKEPPPDAWNIMREMAEFSLKFYKEMASERNDFGYREDGLLELYTSKEQLEQGAKEERSSPFRPKHEIVDVPGFAGGIFFPELSRIETEKFVRRILHELEFRKVRIIKKRASLDLQKGKVDGKESDVIVVSNGIWMNQIFPMPLTAFKGYGYWIQGESKIDKAFVTVDEGVAVSPLSDHVKVTGGFSADFSDNWRGDFVLEKVSNFVKINKIIEKSMGFRPCSPDGFPILGRKGKIVIATGACRLGWSYGPAMGLHSTELALGKAKNHPYLSRLVERYITIPS
ncbi:FAD-binding oxidoreductase [Metallosphaera tengchongensis]|uniref:FAD-binding oxidoreductase n=1 Tax=Metallosphaera tengchongensis TaxID=1532350 RepID=A0A6N0NW51_9CREN|nr:FAD-dependent oxidoreductase [Metallosphaera tengchongensis]QKQ99587.1 FAD-binding oxidoreductase [Metallosphaera tengchongensis]